MASANVYESRMQCVEKRFNTGCKRLANDLLSSWWDKPVIDSIGRNGTFVLCVLGKPYILGLRDLVGQIFW